MHLQQHDENHCVYLARIGHYVIAHAQHRII